MSHPQPVGAFKDLTGLKFPGVLCVRLIGAKNGKTVWLWRCDCGVEFERFAILIKTSIKRGRSASCGCLHSKSCRENGKRRRTHGLSKTRIYDTWRQMMMRCYNDKCKDFNGYGKRGIKVHNDWHKVENFIPWAISSGYDDSLTIERINNDAGYYPENCKWIPNEQQAKNSRRLRKITFNGETNYVSEWAKITGISLRTIINRLNHNWSPEDTLTIKPVRGRNQFGD